MQIANEQCVIDNHESQPVQFRHVDQLAFRELEGRLEARDEWGDEGNNGHDQRIRDVQDQDLLLKNAIAHHEGRYEYPTGGMQDMDEELRRELEEENDRRWAPKEDEGEEQEQEQEQEEEEEDSDMDLCGSDSD